MSKQCKLLIVDNDLSVIDSLDTRLRDEGYEIATAVNAGTALTRLAERRCDAALIDVATTQVDPIGFQRSMFEINPRLIVILMTGHASVEAAIAALKHGASDYVTKPLNLDEVAHRLNKSLALQRSEQENIILRQAVAQRAQPESLRNLASKSLHDIERAHILLILEECGGNQSKAAIALDIDRVTLYHKLKKYGWSRSAVKSGSPEADTQTPAAKLTAAEAP